MPDNAIDKFEDHAKVFGFGLDLLSQYPHYGEKEMLLLSDSFLCSLTIYKHVLTQNSFTGFCESEDKVLGKMFIFYITFHRLLIS